MPALPLVPSDEEAMLREAVFGIASGFGHSYFAEVSRRGEAPHELWQALSEGGFTGVNLPEEEGGVMVLHHDGIDLDAPLTCDWREGDVW